MNRLFKQLYHGCIQDDVIKKQGLSELREGGFLPLHRLKTGFYLQIYIRKLILDGVKKVTNKI